MRKRKACRWRRFVGTLDDAADRQKGKEFPSRAFNENPSYNETMRERKSRRRKIVGTLDEAAESQKGKQFHSRARNV